MGRSPVLPSFTQSAFTQSAAARLVPALSGQQVSHRLNHRLWGFARQEMPGDRDDPTLIPRGEVARIVLGADRRVPAGGLAMQHDGGNANAWLRGQASLQLSQARI